MLFVWAVLGIALAIIAGSIAIVGTRGRNAGQLGRPADLRNGEGHTAANLAHISRGFGGGGGGGG